MRAWPSLALATFALATAGCWVVIGESFSGYVAGAGADASAGDDGGDATADGGRDAAVDAADAGDAAPVTIEGCTPAFVPLNGVTYPPTSTGTLDLTSDLILNTDTSSHCWSGSPSICVVVVSSLHIATGATLWVGGGRALAIVAVHDITIDERGVLNAAGSNEGGPAGPGDHTAGTGTGRGGGGGNAEPGQGSCGSNNGGASVANPGLRGGGHGGGGDHPQVSCQVQGMGGGAVALVSLCGSVTVRGQVNAAGGGGGGGAVRNPACPDGLGGGAGGTVWIEAPPNGFFADPGTGGSINLAGGSGGGGACNSGGAWTSGTSGDGLVPGAGASCAANNGPVGGDGGVGGNRPSSPQPGGDKHFVSGNVGTATCGGGGGGVGWLFLRGTACKAGMTNGVCQAVP